MSLSIENYDRKYLDGMIEVYNAETAFEPYIAMLNPDRFIELVEKKSYFDPKGLFVAIESGKIVGWIHACIAPGSEPHHKPENRVPQIRMIIYPRDKIKVGYILVSEANNWLKISGQKKFLAIHAQEGYPFYRGLWLGGEPMGMSAMPHVQLALESGGYKNTQESIMMTIKINELPNEFRSEVRLEFITSLANIAHSPMRESWIGFEPMTTRAVIKDETIGSIGWVIIPYLTERLGALCLNIWSMGVNEKYRQKGIATALVSYVLRKGYDLGARFASVSTQLWNMPAQKTYAKLGFIPYQLTIGRTLEFK